MTLPSAIKTRKGHKPARKHPPPPSMQRENKPYDHQDWHRLVGNLYRAPDIAHLCPRYERNCGKADSEEAENEECEWPGLDIFHL